MAMDTIGYEPSEKPLNGTGLTGNYLFKRHWFSMVLYVEVTKTKVIKGLEWDTTEEYVSYRKADERDIMYLRNAKILK